MGSKVAKPSKHPFDEIADEVLTWLNEEPEYFIEALRGGHQTPFSADVSESQKMDYYRRQVFMQNPDGSVDFTKPNGEGRDLLIKRVGIKGYTDIMSQVMPNSRGGIRQLPLPSPEEEDDEEYEDAPTMSGY
jgi:hypothetical protein